MFHLLPFAGFKGIFGQDSGLFKAKSEINFYAMGLLCFEESQATFIFEAGYHHHGG